MLTMFTGVSLEYEVELVLLADDVRGVSLTGEQGARRLGWDTYLVAGPQTNNRSDVRYEICAL